MSHLTLAVDVGGTNMRAALVAGNGRIVERRRERTPHSAACPDALFRLVASLPGAGNATRAVVGVPGRVDYMRGRLEHAPNLPPGWTRELTEDRLSSLLDLQVWLANDADLAGVGEYAFGSGRGATDMVYVTVSTGVGAAAILDGRLARGRRSIAEAGHVIVDRAAVAAGRPGTVEAQGSGTALRRSAEEAALWVYGPELLELVVNGDPVAAEIWTRAVDAVGAGIASLAHLFSPEVIVLGGGVGLTGLVEEPVRSYLEAHGPRCLPTPIRVARAALGDDAGLVGAAAWERVSTNAGRAPRGRNEAIA